MLHRITLELNMWAKKNKWKTSLQNHFHGNLLSIYATDSRVISTPKWMLLNSYLICLIFTWGSTIKRIFQVRRSVSGRVQSGGVSPRTFQLGGATLDGNIPFSLMTKGGRFIICKGEWKGKGKWGSMSDMTSILHQSVSINIKGGYFWLIGLVVIDVNPWRKSGSKVVWVMDPRLFDG
jgi:hypothetical protein